MHLVLCPRQGAPKEQVAHLRVFEDAVCRALHTDTATFHHDSVGGDSQAGTHVLLNQQECCAHEMHLHNSLKHQGERLRIETHRGLIHQHQRRIKHEDASYLDLALLATR